MYTSKTNRPAPHRHEWTFAGTSTTVSGRPTVIQKCAVCGTRREFATSESGRQYRYSR